MFEHIGYSSDAMFKIGIVEVTIVILFLIPPTAFVGAILLIAYLGGATATHVRVEDLFFMPITIGIVVCVALGCRDSRVFTIAFSSRNCQ